MKVVIAVIVALLLAGAGVAGGIYYANQTESNNADATAATQAADAKLHFFPMKRFVVSVSEENYSRYLVLELSLASKSDQFIQILADQAPLLRNVLVKHFANTDREQAKKAFEDVNGVQAQLLTQFNEALKKQGIKSQLEQVLVTNVYLQ